MARGDRRGRQHHPDIPLLPAPLIGREADLAAGRQLLTDGARLLTLTGPPGVGKTSLALALAADQANLYADGVCLTDLSAVTDPELVAETIADTLGALGRRKPVDRLVATLRNRQFLLLLDNFERVVSAAPMIAELLAACPELTVIITSRIPLRIRWERELLVEPLGLPAAHSTCSATAVGRAPSAHLFVERARSVSPTFILTDQNASAVAQICVRLDGLPLAIELAGARARLLSPAAILEQLGDPDDAPCDGERRRPRALGLLADGPRDLPARQQTLRDAIAWSHALLTPAEKRLFHDLAVFAGGCTLEAAAQVCGADWSDLASLVEKSLLRQEPPASDDPAAGAPRTRMLEMVRAFALEQLATSGHEPTLRARHLSWAVALAEAAAPHLIGPQQDRWLTRLARERDNLRAAARWATASGDVESALRLSAALFRFWRARGDGVSVREQVAQILALADRAPSIPAAMKAFEGTGELAGVVGDYAAAQHMYERSLEIARQLGDALGEAAALRRLAQLSGIRGHYQEADRLGRESLAILEQLGNRASLAGTLRELGMLSYFAGDQARARQLHEQSIVAARETGDQWRLGDAQFGLALSHHVTGDLDAAHALYEQVLEINEALGNRAAVGSVLNNLGHLAMMRGDIDEARSLLRASLLASDEGGDRRRQAFTLSAVAVLAAVEAQPRLALQFDAAGLATLDTLGVTLAPPMRDLYDTQLAPARVALGAAEAQAAADAGRLEELDEAVGRALAWLDGATGQTSTDQDLEAGSDKEPEPSAAALAGARRPATPALEHLGNGSGRPDQRLTPRERDVAALVARGLTNRQIATALVVTEGTAANYVQRVLNRLGLSNRAQIAAWAVQHGLDDTAPGESGQA